MCCPDIAVSKSPSDFCLGLLLLLLPFPNSPLTFFTCKSLHYYQSIVCGCLSCNRKLPLSQPWVSSSLVGQRNQRKTTETETHRHLLLTLSREVIVTGRFPARPPNTTMPPFHHHQHTHRMTGIRARPSNPPASSHHHQDGVLHHHSPSSSTNITTISALRHPIPLRHNSSNQYRRFHRQRTAPVLSPRCPWGL